MKLESLEARQLLAVAVNDVGIAVQETGNTTLETSELLANDQATPAAAGALLEYDANLETDLTWTNTGAATGNNVNLGSPILINSATGLNTQFSAIRQAYRFSGDDGGAQPNIKNLSTGDPTNNNVTWELVFKPSDTGSGVQSLWGFGGNGNGTAIYYDADNQSVSFIIDSGNDTGQLLQVDTAASSISTSEFNHLVGVYTKDTGGQDQLEVYLNGTLLDTDIEVDNDVDNWAGTDGGGIGTTTGTSAANTTAGNFVGEMASLRLYPSAFMAADVTDNFEALTLEPIVSVSSPSNAGALVTLNADETIAYDPNGQFAGLSFGQTATDTFTYSIDDGAGGMSSATVTVTVIGAAEAVTGDLAMEVAENSGATFQQADFPGQLPTAGAALLYDADQETDGIWTNIGTATNPQLDADLNGATLDPVTGSGYPGIGQAYRFDGVNTGGTFLNIEAGVNPNPTLASASFELVFRPDVLGSGNQLLFETGGSGNGTSIFYDADDQSISFIVDGGDDATQVLQVDSSTGSIFSNEFNHLVGVYRKDTDAANTDILDVYLNGVLVGSAFDDDVDDWAGADDGGIGVVFNAAAIGTGSVPYQGEMNLVRFYDNELSGAEVINNFRSVTRTATVVSVTSPTTQGGTATLNPDGTVEYTVPPAFDAMQQGDIATDTFTFTVDDGSGTTTSATATVTVNGENDAPQANDDTLGMTDEETPVTVPAGPATIDSSLYAAEVLAQGPIGFWQLNETSGTLADNQGTAGDPLDGTYEAGMTQGVTGFDPDGDLAAGFNAAANSQVNITGYEGITGTDARTVSAWIRTTDTDSDIIGWGLNNNGEKVAFRTQSGNGTVGAIRVEVNGGFIVGNTVVTDGQWHHVAFTFEDDGSPNVEDIRLYVDGQLDAEVGGVVPPSASQGNVLDTAAGGVVEIGSSVTPRDFDGRIDDVALFDRALDAADIQAQFAARINQAPSILDNDTDPDGDPLAIDSFDAVSANGATITLDTLQTIGNVGMINNLDIAPQTISFGGDFVNPVVIAQPLSENGADPSVARIVNVDAAADEFTVQLIETPDLDNTAHNAENFFFVVLEAGEWELPDGTLLEVGTIDTANTRPGDAFETVTFNTAFGAAPAVLTQTQTNNESGFLETRQDNTTNASFDVILEEAQEGGMPPVTDADGMHVSETVGYIAFEQGTSFTFGSAEFEAFTTAENIDETGDRVDFLGTYTDPPLIVAALASFTGGDPTHLRFRNLDNTGVTFEAEEDTFADAELGHSDEAVSYLAFSGAGEIRAYAPGATPGQFTYDPAGMLDFIPAGEVFTDTFTYTIVDGLGASATATVSVQVTGVNDPPTAVDDAEDAPEDTAVAIDVLANDTDPDIDGTPPEDTLTVTDLDTTGTVGDVTITNGGADVTYDPAGNFESLDDGDTATTTFTYTLEDGSGVTSTATVTVTIIGANDAPVADAGGPYTIDEGQDLVLDASASTDVDTGDTLTYAWDIDNDGQFDDATGDNPTIPFSALQAFADGPGTFDVSVQVSDSDLTGTATATVTVNNVPPVATITPEAATAFPLTDFEITVSADDPADADDAAPFTYELDVDGNGTIDQTMSGPASGVTFTVQYPATGTFTARGFATDKDGGRSAAATATVNVVPVGIDADGNLVAAGTDISDRIIFSSGITGVRVRYNNVFYPPGGGGFSIAPGAHIIATGQGGNDQILITGNILTEVEFDGGTGNDYLAGGISDDILIGGSGNDILLAGEGDNLIIGDTRDGVEGPSGIDRLEGRDGDDTLFGGGGTDRLNAGGGNDILDGGNDNDYLFADTGDDLLVGGNGVDVLNGHSGDDVILGGDAADQLFGSRDQDLLIGGLGADRVRGDSGDDTIVGGESALDDDLEAALATMLASMSRISLMDADATVDSAVQAWFDSNDRAGFEPFGGADGFSDDLIGDTGVDTFHARGTDRLRDVRDGDIEL